MKRKGLALALAISVSALACGGDSSGEEFEGTYQVASHVSGDCSVQDTVEVGDLNGEGFFSLQLDNFLGVPFLGYRSCPAADDCPEDSNLLNSFFEENGEWVLKISGSSGTGPDCQVGASRGSIGFNSAGELEIDIETRSGTITSPDCGDALDLVDENFDNLTCDTIRRMTGTAL